MLKEYKKFFESLSTEEIDKRKKDILNSHMRMYLSTDLMNILKNMKSPVAKELLNLSKNNVKFDISFMDIHRGYNPDDAGKVTFFSTIKVRKLEEKGLDIQKSRNDYNSELWTSKLRVQPTKIGKVAKKIFKDKFHQSEIESFGNEFKAKTDNNNRLKIVYGNDIKKWYLGKNYASNNGSLGGSCMRYDEKNKFLNIYSENDQNNESFSHIGMLILTDENNKLLARALVWFNSIKPEPGRIFMDRIYYSNDHQIDIFKEYANSNGWIYKHQQTYNNATYIDPNDNNKHTLSISFRLKPKKYEYYPFLDTLMYYTPDTGRISSIQSKNKKFKSIKIQSQDGTSRNI